MVNARQVSATCRTVQAKQDNHHEKTNKNTKNANKKQTNNKKQTKSKQQTTKQMCHPSVQALLRKHPRHGWTLIQR
jgi:hypothetical protein